MEKSKQKLKDNKDSLITEIFNKSKEIKLVFKIVKDSNKKIEPKTKVNSKYCFEPSFSSDNFIFNIINTNKNRTAIAPT